MILTPAQKRYLSVFTGPNGTGVGLQYAGWHMTDSIEYDYGACDTIAKNYHSPFPYVIHNRDIREQMVEKLSFDSYPLAVYTWPCPNYSGINVINGPLKGDDLYLHAMRMHALLYPEFALIENVFGMLKFPVVMEMIKKYRGYYKTRFNVYGHEYTMQQKRRCFIFLHRQPFAFEYPTPPKDIPIPGYIPARPGRQLKDYLDPPGTKFECHPSFMKRVNGGYARLPRIYRPWQTEPLQLMTNQKRDRGQHVLELEDGSIRAFTVEEHLRLHGFPEGYVISGRGPGGKESKGRRYQQVTDSVMPPVAYTLGLMINKYFESIQGFAPRPDAPEENFIESVDPRKRKEYSDMEKQELIEEFMQDVVDPIPVGTEQASLF